ncbi:MAG: response regulator [Desulfuromonadales bacterium]|nr:response regulator [Chloroflexota bacterium]MCK4621612.1 response regulator [Desulfuromonadales bacterium]
MSQIRLLIVDDESSIRESLAEFLRDFNIAVDSASDAEAALDIMAKKQFDVLLADLRLPGMAGDLMITRAHRLQPQMRFLIHTGSIDYRLSEELIALGLTPEDIILKPLSDLTVLLNKIQSKFKQSSC